MTRRTLEIGGRTRSYLHVAPPMARPGAPLIIGLHGAAQTGSGMREFSGRTLDALAARIGAELVYPDGRARRWALARGADPSSAAGRAAADDAALLTTLIERSGGPAILVGYSNGGGLVHQLIRDAPELVLGAAVIAAGLPTSHPAPLSMAAARIPVLVLHGTRDPLVPHDGGPLGRGGGRYGAFRSALETAQYYAGDAAPAIERTAALSRYDWGRVRFLSQIGAGHIIPNRLTRPTPFWLGRSHQDIDTGEELGGLLGI